MNCRTIGIVLGVTVAAAAGATALVLATGADAGADEGLAEASRTDVTPHHEVAPPRVMPPRNVEPPRVAPSAPEQAPENPDDPRRTLDQARATKVLAVLTSEADEPSDHLGDAHGVGASGRGLGTGGGRGGLGLIGARSPSVSHGPTVVRGGLDPQLVRRYVRRIANRIQYCYERRLVAVPTLAGTSRVTFRIAATGQVESASASGLDAEVDGCLAEAIRSIEFPKPKGGGPADVVYPITFKPA